MNSIYAHRLGYPFLPEKNNGIKEPNVADFKGVNNYFVGYDAKKKLYS